MRGRTWFLLILVLSLAGPACEKKPRAGDGKGGGVLAEAPFLKLVPGDAPLAIAVDGAERVLPRLGYQQVTREIGADFEQAVAAVKKASGHNLLDPASWDAAGLDAKRAGGFALFDARNGVFGVYVPTSDAGRAEQTLRTLSKTDGEELKSRQAGQATILETDDDEVAFVLRDGYLVFVFAEEEEALLPTCEKLATLEAGASLAQQAGFKKALAPLPQARDLAAYVDIAAIINAFIGEMGGEEVAMVRKLLGNESTLVAGVQIEGRTIGLQLHMAAPADSGLRKIYRNGKGTPRILTAVEGETLMLAHLSFDPQALRGLIEDIARQAAGEKALAEVDGQMRMVVGVGWEEAFKLLDGELGYMMTGSLEAMMADEDGKPGFGGGVVLGVTDEKKARGVWDRVKGLVGASGDSFEVPGLGQVHIQFGNGVVAMGTSASFVEKAISGKGTPMRHPNPELAKLLETKDVTALVVENLGAFGAMFMLRSSADVVEPPVVPAPGTDPARVAELEALEKEIDQIEKTTEQGKNKHLGDMLRVIGSLALVMKETDQGFLMTGGQYVEAPSVAEASVQVTRHAMRLIAIDAERDRLWEKRERAWALRRELQGSGGGEIAVPPPPIPPPPGTLEGPVGIQPE